MYITGRNTMSKKYHITLTLLCIFIFLGSNIFAVNKIPVSGIVQNIDGLQLVEVQLSLKRQNKSATTNRFGEFDLGKVFPNDTLLITMNGYQYQSLTPKSNMLIKLYPKSIIQEKINNARNGETIIIPSGVHYIYPDFNIDSTVGMTINYKNDITIIGEKNSEIRLKWYNADILYIHESNNINLKNFTIGYYDPLNNIEEIIAFDDARNFNNAFGMARRQLGKNSIFKYKGRLYHTNNPKEPSDKIIPGSAINIYNSSDIFIDSVNVFGKNNICLNANYSKNIIFNQSKVNEGIYGFVFNKCENIKIENSIISDNSEILFSQSAQAQLNENIIKIAGHYVPEFVLVSGGSIELLDESIIPPPKPRYLNAGTFSISRKEITFEQYDAFCIATNRDFPDDSEWGRGKMPVINITYEDALSYTKWLSKLLGKTIRLPEINEWEFAARGGIKGGDDKSYSGGNILKDVAWCKYNTKDKPENVGLKIPNELGIFDMSGNVYEFCNGVIDSMIVLKGGSWANSGVGCRVQDKVVSKVDFWDDNIGFRVVEGDKIISLKQEKNNAELNYSTNKIEACHPYHIDNGYPDNFFGVSPDLEEIIKKGDILTVTLKKTTHSFIVLNTGFTGDDNCIDENGSPKSMYIYVEEDLSDIFGEALIVGSAFINESSGM